MATRKTLQEKIANSASPDATVRAATRWPRLTRWQGVFLEEWIVSKNRLEAITKAGMKIADLDEALETNPRFQNAYAEVWREITVTLEDAQLKSAIEGKNSGAQKLALEAHSAQYQKKPNAAKRGGAPSAGAKMSGVKEFASKAERRWGAIFESTRSGAKREPSAHS